MAELVECRFFGGPVDGRVMKWEWGQIHGGMGIIRIPEGPMFNEHWLDNWDELDTPEEVEHRRALARSWFDLGVHPIASSPYPRITEYRFDGTIDDHGVRRMRWSGRYT